MSDQQVSMQSRKSFHNDNKLKLGLFGANCSSGRAITKIPERWSGSWEDNLRMARIADEAGIDFLLPIARWRGYGGETDFEGTTLEAITWATGLLAKTERITVFATVHVPLFHPIIAAKQMVTADHIGGGRFGLNLVVGWNEGEFQMFGVDQRGHDQRYDYAQEWIDAVLRMWGPEEEFDAHGQFIDLAKVRAKPKPYGGSRPLMMNAGASGIGQNFAVKNCDAFFTAVRPEKFEEATAKVTAVRELARQQGRGEMGVYTIGVVTCRPTKKEAEDFVRYYRVDNIDWGAVDYIIGLRGIDVAKLTPEELKAHRSQHTGGVGGFDIIGDPDDVAREIARVSAAGLDGIGVSLVNYADELPYFCQEVLPRLEKMGLRVKVG